MTTVLPSFSIWCHWSCRETMKTSRPQKSGRCICLSAVKSILCNWSWLRLASAATMLLDQGSPAFELMDCSVCENSCIRTGHRVMHSVRTQLWLVYSWNDNRDVSGVVPDCRGIG